MSEPKRELMSHQPIFSGTSPFIAQLSSRLLAVLLNMEAILCVWECGGRFGYILSPMGHLIWSSI